MARKVSFDILQNKVEQTDGANPRPFGTSVMSPADSASRAGATPEASGDSSSGTLDHKMKTRILLILSLGALALSLFESWRYRAANKDFKALFEAERAETKAALYSSWVYNDAWSAFLDSSLMSQGYIRFSESRFSSRGYADRPNEREPSVSIRFSVERPFTDTQTQELNEIVARLQTDYDRKVDGLWRVRTGTANGELRFSIFANVPITDAKFSRFD